MQARYIVLYTMLKFAFPWLFVPSGRSLTTRGMVQLPHITKSGIQEKQVSSMILKTLKGCTMCWYLSVAMATKQTDTTELQVSEKKDNNLQWEHVFLKKQYVILFLEIKRLILFKCVQFLC